MKILVTGGLGFIGINFINRLLKKKNTVILNLDKESYSSNIFFHHHLKKNSNYTYIKFDLNNNNDLLKIIN